MDKNQEKIIKLVQFSDDPGLAIYDELQEINDGLEEFNQAFSGVDLTGLTQIEGEKGEKGDPGKDGKDGKDGKQGPVGPQGPEGYDGFDGKDGKDGRDGQNGKDGSPDTPLEVKMKLESLQGDSRLDASAIKNLPSMVGKIAKDGYPYGLPQPAGAMTYRLNGAQVGRGNILNITGSGITATPLDDGITYNITGGGGSGSPSVPFDSVQYNNAGSFGGDGNFVRDPGGTFFGVRSILTTGATTQFLEDSNIFGFGIDGILVAYSADGFGSSFLGMLAGDFAGIGGADNSMIIGYQSFVGGAIANTNYIYNSVSNETQVRIEASTLTKQARINIEADTSVSTIDFDFGGSNKYKFPSTQPTPGTVLGYASPGVTDWIPNGGSAGITIGDPISGGGANRILYEDGSNNLAESSNFAYNDSTGVFTVAFGGGNRLVADPNSNTYGIGDLTVVNNGNYLNINDGASVISFGVGDIWQVYNTSTADQWIKLEIGSSKITIGDAGNNLNGNRFEINDATEITTLYTSKQFQVIDDTANFRYLDINPGTTNYAIGDLNNQTNFTYFNINDFARQVFVQVDGDFGVQNVSGSRSIDAQMGGGIGTFYVHIGDATLTGNRTRITVDDGGLLIQADSRDGVFRAGDVAGIGLGATLDVVNTAGAGQISRHGGIVDDRIDTQAYGTTRNVTNRDHLIRVGTSSTGATTINLPTTTVSPEGQIFIILDSGNASSGNNITIDAGTGSIIRGRYNGAATSAQTLVMATDAQCITLKKVNSSTWAIESHT